MIGMPDLDVILVGVIVLAAMAFFIWDRFRIDGVAICVLAALFVFGLITPEQTVSGFTSAATVTIAAMFVISNGLVRTGLVDWLARHVDRLAGKTETRLMLTIALTAAVLSAFLINTAIVAIFIPVSMVLARSRKTAPSRVLMPLSFASQFGGVCTLIGTSTNLIVNAIGIERGLEPFGFFEFAPLGLALTGAGMIYLATVGRFLLPVRKAEEEEVDRFRLADYLAQAEVQDKSDLIGKIWERAKIGAETGIELANLLRGQKAVSRPTRTVIKAGDILLLHGHIEQILKTESGYGLKIMKEARVKDRELSSHDMKLTEAMVPPGSSLVGRTLEKAIFFHRHRLSILAIQRRNQTMRESLADIRLKEHDTLLLLGHKDDLAHIMNSPNLIVTNELTELYLRRDRAIMAVATLSLVVVLTTLSIMPIMLAAILGAVAMVVTRCLTVEEAYEAIDWKIIFLLGGMLPLGVALEQTGAATWMVNNLLGPILGAEPLALLAVIYILTAIFTEVMSNHAAAVILAPIAFTAAIAANLDPRPFLVAITFAASTSFTTPIGYQTNTMIYAPGGYRFTDFFKVGLPLNIVFMLLSILLIPLIWPL